MALADRIQVDRVRTSAFFKRSLPKVDAPLHHLMNRGPYVPRKLRLVTIFVTSDKVPNR